MSKLFRRTLSAALALLLLVTGIFVTPVEANTKAEKKISNPKTVSVSKKGKLKTAPENDYTLLWSDDFDSAQLDTNYWNQELRAPGWTNNELQEYTASAENCYIEDGSLILKAAKTEKNGSPYYTSAKVTTRGKFDFKYGKAEARIKVPKGQGLWPAFWMMPANEQFYGTWPLCGEIDIFELLGHEPNKAYGTVHYGNPHKESQGTYILENGDFSDDYHVYAVEWEPGVLKFYLDGKLYHTVNNWYSKADGMDEVTFPAPFDQNFFLQLNLAVGGNWPGNPDDTTDFEKAKLYIDYVKVYQKQSYDENISKPEQEFSFKEPDAEGNYISNADFRSPLSKEDWELLNAAGGAGSSSITDHVLRIESTDAGTQLYSVQLVQPNLPMYRAGSYRLTFQARADQSRAMVVDISAPENGWSRYLADTSVELNSEWNTYTYDFTVNSDDDPYGRLEFNLGAQGSTAAVELKNVRLEKTAQAVVPEPEKTVQPDGNYVYNGEFQYGEGRLKYWEVNNNLPGATVTVTNQNTVRQLKATVPEASGNIRDLTVKQTGLSIQPETQYRLSFDAYSGNDVKVKNKKIKVQLGSQIFTAALTAEKQTFTFDITTADTPCANILKFLLGTAGTVYIDNVKLKEAALIINGEFYNGTAGWEVFADSSISSQVTHKVVSHNNSDALLLSIADTGDADWKIQLKQNHIALEKGKWYKLSLEAASDINRQLMFALQRDGNLDNDWTPYSGTEVVNLTSEPKTFEKTFQMTNETDLQTILSISMGCISANHITSPHHIWIDHIKLEEIN